MMAEDRVFGCEDLRRIIFEFVYPTKILTGMTATGPNSHLHPDTVGPGIITMIRKNNSDWLVDVRYEAVDKLTVPYAIINHHCGARPPLKITSSKRIFNNSIHFF